MKEEVLLLTLVIQFAVQLGLYLTSNKFFYCLIKKMVVSLSLGHKFFDLKRQEMANALTAGCLIIYNICLSLLVLKFTSTGALAGITNLGASVCVGVIMAIQYGKYGKYYIEVQEDWSFLEKTRVYLKDVKKRIAKRIDKKLKRK